MNVLTFNAFTHPTYCFVESIQLYLANVTIVKLPTTMLQSSLAIAEDITVNNMMFFHFSMTFTINAEIKVIHDGTDIE